MPADTEYLRRHYASLSDQALLDIDRTELVESAQKCYDEELVQRKLAPQRGRVEDATSLEKKPAWADEANEVFSQVGYPGAVPAPEIANAREALEAAGIPCYLDLSDQEEEPRDPRPMKIWRLMVPGNLNQHATSILERDIFNTEFEAEWRTHLEMLSDEELRAMDPKLAFCGLFDRAERVTRAFDEELARRQSKSTAPWFS
jgi:hypothetical protein